MDAKAKKIEAITDDDEGLSSLCIWFEEGGYVAIARGMDSTAVHCELNDQSNGFYPLRLDYKISGTLLLLQLFGAEFFDNKRAVQDVRVDLAPANTDLAEVLRCLKSVFDDV